MFSKKNLQIIAYCLLSVFATLAFVGWQMQQLTGNAADTLKFLRAMYVIKHNFDGKVDNSKLFDGAIDGMVKSLDDPYTVYLDKKAFADLSEATIGSFGGIGIVFGKRDDDYVVISALPDNPGALAGIKGGDKIIEVDGKPTKDMNMEEVATKIRGEIDSEVTLKLLDKEGKEKVVRVIRKEIKTQSVGAEMLPNSKIGYIRVVMFNEKTGVDFDKAYEKLEKEGMQATILDLRGNPGGVLDDGVAVAKKFVPKGPIVSIIYNDGSQFVENSDLPKIKYPLAVLVDGGSASASEIVAGAIKDTKSGKLFGTKTFGKGSVQGVYRLDAATAIKVTTAKYYTPSGVSIHNVGIEPDVVVELPENATEDLQLKAAEKYLQEELSKRGE